MLFLVRSRIPSRSRAAATLFSTRWMLPPRNCRHRHTGYGFPNEYIHTIRAGKTIIWTTIGACTAVFGAWQYSRSARPSGRVRQANMEETTGTRILRFLSNNFVLSSNDPARGKYWTLLTSAFSHVDAGHLLGNMFTFHAFGTVLVYSLVPPGSLVTLMFGSAIAGSIGYLYHEQNQPRLQQSRALGASGMVMGVGAAAAMLRPSARILLFGVVPVPMWALLAGYIAYDSLYMDNPASRVGHAAHLGGIGFGACFYALALRRFGGVFGRRGF